MIRGALRLHIEIAESRHTTCHTIGPLSGNEQGIWFIKVSTKGRLLLDKTYDSDLTAREVTGFFYK